MGCAEVEVTCGCPQQSETGDLEGTECGEEGAQDVVGNCFQAVLWHLGLGTNGLLIWPLKESGGDDLI